MYTHLFGSMIPTAYFRILYLTAVQAAPFDMVCWLHSVGKDCRDRLDAFGPFSGWHPVAHRSEGGVPTVEPTCLCTALVFRISRPEYHFTLFPKKYYGYSVSVWHKSSCGGTLNTVQEARSVCELLCVPWNFRCYSKSYYSTTTTAALVL